MVRAALAGAVALLLLSGCGSNPTGTAAETPYDFSFTDPAGDTTVATANPDSVRAIDLVTVSGSVDSDEIHLVLEFAEPISRWSDGLVTGLDGFVFFDTDQSTGTGRRDHAPVTVGAEFYLDLRDDGSGRVGLVNFLKKTITVLDGTFDGTRFEVTIPRSALSSTSDADNKLNLAVELSGRRRAPIADRGDVATAYQLEPPVPAQ